MCIVCEINELCVMSSVGLGWSGQDMGESCCEKDDVQHKCRATILTVLVSLRLDSIHFMLHNGCGSPSGRSHWKVYSTGKDSSVIDSGAHL